MATTIKSKCWSDFISLRVANIQRFYVSECVCEFRGVVQKLCCLLTNPFRGRSLFLCGRRWGMSWERRACFPNGGRSSERKSALTSDAWRHRRRTGESQSQGRRFPLICKICQPFKEEESLLFRLGRAKKREVQLGALQRTNFTVLWTLWYVSIFIHAFCLFVCSQWG